MGALRRSKNLDQDLNMQGGDYHDMHYHNDQPDSAPSTGYPSGVYVPSMNQGVSTLIVMLVVLFIIMLFCFWGAPAVRAFCKRKICFCCNPEEPDTDGIHTEELQDYVFQAKHRRLHRQQT